MARSLTSNRAPLTLFIQLCPMGSAFSTRDWAPPLARQYRASEPSVGVLHCCRASPSYWLNGGSSAEIASRSSPHVSRAVQSMTSTQSATPSGNLELDISKWTHGRTSYAVELLRLDRFTRTLRETTEQSSSTPRTRCGCSPGFCPNPPSTRSRLSIACRRLSPEATGSARRRRTAG